MKKGKSRPREQPEKQESLFKIDILDLINEWNEHADTAFRWNEKLADAKRTHDELKSALYVVECELDRDIRNNPEGFDVLKVTDKAVEKTIPLQRTYQKAEAAVREAKHRVDVLTAYCASLRDRRKALENIVELHGQQYWSMPRTNDEGMDRASKRAIRNPKKRRPKEDRDDDD